MLKVTEESAARGLRPGTDLNELSPTRERKKEGCGPNCLGPG